MRHLREIWPRYYNFISIDLFGGVSMTIPLNDRILKEHFNAHKASFSCSPLYHYHYHYQWHKYTSSAFHWLYQNTQTQPLATCQLHICCHLATQLTQLHCSDRKDLDFLDFLVYHTWISKPPRFFINIGGSMCAAVHQICWNCATTIYFSFLISFYVASNFGEFES